MASSSLPIATTAESVPAPKISSARKWSILVVLSLALAIIILDTTILNVALSAIIRDLNTDIQKLQWVITAYSLTLAALTITGGRLGDLFGRKRMFIVGAILFAAGSFLASISTNVGMLVAGEAIIEGIGAALMMPATASLLVVNFQGRERVLAFGVWGGIAGAAAALGPILGGYLTTHYNWRWGFRINLFVVFLLLVGSFLIPESRDTKEKKELDFVGVILSAVGMLSLVFGIIEASTYGWWKAKAIFFVQAHALVFPWGLSIVPFCILLGLLILAVFAIWEQYREESGHTPLVSMSIFKNTQFTAGVATTAVMSLGQTGLIFALPVFLQSVRGFDAYHTGLALLPMSLALLVVAPLAAVLSKNISSKVLISTGLLINIIAYIVLRYTLSIETTTADLIPGLALFGIGMGMVMSQINNLTLSAVPMHQAGEASGINNTFRQVGSTLGSAIIGTILIGTLGARLVTGVQTSPVIPETMKPSIATAIEAQTSNIEFGGGAQLGESVPAEVQTEITRIGHQATVEANKTTLLYGAIFAALGFFVSLLLPGKKKKSSETAVTETNTTLPKNETADPARPLDTALVAELLQADLQQRAQGRPGLGSDVRLLIDVSAQEEGFSQAAFPRYVQARVLWDKGFGRALGFETFAAYLQSIPVVPEALQRMDPHFPRLLFVEGRLSAAIACRLLNVQPRGNEATAQMQDLQVVGQAQWIRCQEGQRYLGKSVQEAEQQFRPAEQGLSVSEGLALLAQHPNVVATRYLDLPNSPHEGFGNSTACLGIWEGQTELRWRWRDHEDPRCAAATRKQ